MLNSGIKNIYFIGIGGAGMMPLAIHCKKLGYSISGSDLNDESFSQLNRHGILTNSEQNSDLTNIDIVVYSSAVGENNLEYITAKKKEISLYKRAELVGFLTKQSHSILIAGSHGKSTTTVMLSDILFNHENFRASSIIGAESISQNSNYYDGKEKYLIVEADEYDKSFLKMYPNDLIILNIDNDHLDIYKNINGLIKAFKQLVSKLDKNSLLVYNADDKNVIEAVSNVLCKKVSFGLKENISKYKNIKYYYAKNVVFENFTTVFDLFCDINYRDGSLGSFKINSTGEHNLYNSLASIIYCLESNITPKEVIELSKSFIGLKRRNEIILKNEEYILIDDYAHHPTEVVNAIKSIKNNHTSKGRLVVLFQPHLFSRTLDHYKEFAKSFDGVDKLYISHIYPARESNDGSITSNLIFDAMDNDIKDRTKVYNDFDDLYNDLITDTQKGDLILSLGAGEINKVLYKIKETLE